MEARLLLVGVSVTTCNLNTTHSMASSEQALFEEQYDTDEQLADAKLLSKEEVLFIIENLTVKFLNALMLEEDLELTLVSQCFTRANVYVLKNLFVSRLTELREMSKETLKVVYILVKVVHGKGFWVIAELGLGDMQKVLS